MALTITSEAEAIAVINVANGTNFRSLEEVRNFLATQPSANESLHQMLNKISLQVATDYLNAQILDDFRNVFATNGAQVPAGAYAEILGAGLLKVVDDTITTAVDLLPDLTATPDQYVKRAERNVQKRVELVINEGIFKRAFLNVEAFSNFINIITKRISDAEQVFIYNFISSEVLKGIKNITDLTGATGAQYPEIVGKLYSDLANYAPISNNMNLGAVKDAKVIKASELDNADGADIVAMTNTLETKKDGEIIKYPTLIAITKGAIDTNIANELSKIYHDDTLSFKNKFKSVIWLTPENYTILKTAYGIADGTDFAIVIDERALAFFTFLHATKSQLWIKGPGDGTRQLVQSFWHAITLIPFANGKVYTFKYAAPANT